MKTLYIGIDNGYRGAVAALCPDGAVLHQPVVLQDLGKDKWLDVRQNREIVRRMIQAAGVTPEQVLATYEVATKNPLFGISNNYANGKNGEFWRVLLTVEEIPFTFVYPQVWQRHVFHGLHGDDTKAMAGLVVQSRFPRVVYPGYNAEQVRGANDAICIALWAREKHQ